MIDISHLILEVIAQGGIYALVVMAVYLTSRVISFDDLTIEGSFSVGGAVAAHLLYMGAPATITLIAGALCGAASGVVTALISRTLPISKVISGVVVTAALYSVSLKIGSSFLSLATHPTLFAGHETNTLLHPAILITLIALACWVLVKYFLQTEIGFMLHALGNNPQMLTNLGKRITTYTVIALGVANLLTGLAGALFVHYLGFFSITGAIGTLIIALTSLMLAELFGTGFGFVILVGSLLFQAIITTTIAMQVDPVWNRLITAALLIILMAVKKMSARKE